ncbi:uncharacterized protein LOC110734875 [Chenopodium quinoa]|uniref:uncharacterized protein LOC110734875 n=1 Tax=Chenopodium quinoa TaxID=63459 RepID=UPI000B775060|nr:uncharacterized protein LOC110734875 [Chenopodium quinoa]
MDFASAAARLGALAPTATFGWDSEGSSGGLLVLGWSNAEVVCLYSSKKFILCKINELNGSLKYVLFFYGEPQVDKRRIIWEQLQWFLEEFKNVLVIGDFNQVERGSDKLGGSNRIRGIEAFLDWRFSSNVTEVPFSGPKFTWSNKREGDDLILERLDRAYITEEWFDHSPDGKINHEPIVCSDHVAITYHEQPKASTSNRPYQIENWCLAFPEIKEIVGNLWKEEVRGSFMFQLSRKLDKLRSKMQYWCLDNKKVWGINWRKLTKDLRISGMNVSTLHEGEGYIQHINLLIPESLLGFSFWKQRMKANWIRYGDCPTPTMYRKVKQRQLQSLILTLRNEEDMWVEGERGVKDVILSSIKDIYNPITNDNHGEYIDLLLRQLAIPCLSEEERGWLDRDFSEEEIKKAMFDMHCSKSPGPNGFTVDFFKVYWNEVGRLVTNSVMEFLRIGNMLKERNQSLPVLIPKAKVGPSKSDYGKSACLHPRKSGLAFSSKSFTSSGVFKSLDKDDISVYLNDDAMLFFKASKEACMCISDILLRFGKASGQKLNLQKSLIKFSPDVDNDMKVAIKQILSMPETDNMGINLGAPIDIQGKNSTHFQFLVDKVTEKIISWSSLRLSQSAKLILINTVLLKIIWLEGEYKWTQSVIIAGWIQHYILLFNSEDGKHSNRCTVFIATLWGLWKSRNARCFKGSTETISSVRDFINLAMNDHEIFNLQASPTPDLEVYDRENPTFPPGFYHVDLGKDKSGYDDFTVEVDGSWDKKTRRVGISWAVKSIQQGNAMDEGGKHGVAASAIQCEAWACLEAMKWARAKGKQGILVLSDSIGLLTNLQGNHGKDISISWLLKELRVLKASFQRCTILKVQRDQVQKANDIARKCRTNLLTLL